MNRPAAEAFAAQHWITQPSGSTITIVGIAGRKGSYDDSIKDALNDAARKVSLYYRAKGEYTIVQNDGTNILDKWISTDSKVELLNGNFASYVDSLVYEKDTDIILLKGNYYVRTRYSGVADVPAYTSVVEKDGKPRWVTGQPVLISGYLTGIGGSRNKGKGKLQETYMASYEAAVLDVVQQLSSNSKNRIFDTEGGGRILESITMGKATVTNVMILETYFDQKTSAVYTLVAAKAGGAN
jgi:hypothetical protein